MELRKPLKALVFGLLCASGAILAHAYEAGILKNHNHTSAIGDGGQLSNLTVNGTLYSTGASSATTVTATAQHLAVDSSSSPTTAPYGFTNETNTGIGRVQLSAVNIPAANFSASIPIITATNHGLYHLTPVLFSAASGTPPTGLTTGTTYFVRWVDINHIALCTTVANANNTTDIQVSAIGTGTNTFTPLAAHDLGFYSQGKLVGWIAQNVNYGVTSSTAQIFIGGRTEPTQASEGMHIEGTGGVSGDYSYEYAVYNTTGAAARFVASAGYNNFSSSAPTVPASASYLIAYGTNSVLNGTYWTNGPKRDLTGEVELQSVSNNFYEMIQDQTGNNIYFWSHAANPVFNFCSGASCGSLATIQLNGIQLGSWSLSQLQGLTTVAGMIDYCNNCVTDAVCVSTGTINSFVRQSARTIPCQ